MEFIFQAGIGIKKSLKNVEFGSAVECSCLVFPAVCKNGLCCLLQLAKLFKLSRGLPEESCRAERRVLFRSQVPAFDLWSLIVALISLNKQSEDLAVVSYKEKLVCLIQLDLFARILEL